MKQLVFLFIVFFLLGCSKEDPDPEIFTPVPYIGDIRIDSGEDIAFLREFYNAGFNIIEGYLRIDPAARNIDYSTLSNIVEVTDEIYINNPTLTNLDFLNRLRYAGSIHIQDSEISFSSVELPALEKVNGDLRLYLGSITTVPVIEVDQSFSQLDSIGGELYLSLAGSERQFLFPELENAGKLSIVNSSTSSLVFPQKLRTLDYLAVSYCANISNLNGLGNLDAIGDFKIDHCDNLLSIDGLEYLELIETDLNILTNEKLQDFCALKGTAFIHLSESAHFRIQGNAYNPTKEMLINGQCSSE